jgi:hypothetical protein
MKRKSFVVAAVLGCGVTVVSMAYAANWSGRFNIDELQAHNGDIAYRVKPVGAIYNPHGCSKTVYYEAGNVSAESGELMSKALMSAMLAGKQVELSVTTSTCSAGGYPAYVRVKVYR